MRKILFILLITICCALTTPSHANEANEPPKIIKNSNIGLCADLGENLKSCKKYKCSMPHPNANKFQIEHQILGFSGDDLLCWHTQTIPGNGIIDCRYDRKTRKLMAKQFSQKKEILDDQEVALIGAAFKESCSIIE